MKNLRDLINNLYVKAKYHSLTDLLTTKHTNSKLGGSPFYLDGDSKSKGLNEPMQLLQPQNISIQ